MLQRNVAPPCPCIYCDGRCPEVQNLAMRRSYGARCSKCGLNCSKSNGSRLKGWPEMGKTTPQVSHAGLPPPHGQTVYATQPDVGLFGEHQVRCDVLGSSAGFLKRCVDFGRRLQVGGQGTAAACGGRVEAGSEAALEEKVTSILGESQEADGQADGPLDETGFIYGVGAAEGTREHGAVAPVGAATFPGSGRLQVLLHGTPTYKGAAALGVLCVRRLRERLGMRDLWAPDLDLVIGAPYAYLELDGTSGALCVATAVVAYGTGAAARFGWTVTGALSLSGHVQEVASVRCKAVAAYKSRSKGLVLPKANLMDVRSDEWPADSNESEEVRRLWPLARRRLLFKGVETLEETLAFFFPSLASSLQGPARRGRGRPASVKRAAVAGGGEVGPATFVTTPLPGLNGGRSRLVRAEACFVRGPRGPPTLSGGHSAAVAQDAHLAWLMVTVRVEALEALVQSEVRGGRLAWDPRGGGEEGSAHVNLLHAPTNGPGLMLLPMFLALAALLTGLEVRPQLSVFGFCGPMGEVPSVGQSLQGVVGLAHGLGVQTLVLAEEDAELLGAEAQAIGLTLLSVRHVDELLTTQVFQRRPRV